MEPHLVQQQLSSRRGGGGSHSKDSEYNSIQGMESVVATVSGYHGSERFKLIKLISHTGASYVGAMNQSTTHLICWKFEGRKYHLAKQFKTLIVNHQWVEDCIKQGRRIPEHPYTLWSGQEVGPLQLEIPLVAKKLSPLLFGQPNKQKGSKEAVIDIESEEYSDVAWSGSNLINELLLLEGGRSSNKSKNVKKKTLGKSLRRDNSDGSRNCFQEPQHSGAVRMEHQGSSSSSTQMVREKRSSSALVQVVQPSSKGRKLVKKGNDREHLEFICLDTMQEIYPFPLLSKHKEITVPSNRSEGRNIKKLINQRNSNDESSERGGGNRNVEENKHQSNIHTFEDLCVQREDALTCAERTAEDECYNSENSNKIKDFTRLPTSTELSCVICWTDFSSTRGVLPCGHRFCFSCIQSWADHMASRRKTSTCPLCKASFMSITKVDDAVFSDQKIYSQTIPVDPMTTDIFFLPEGETYAFGAEPSVAPACCECRCREPEDLLVRCHICQVRCIHSYCLDPPLFPWTCIHCKDLRMLYTNIR